MTKKYIIKNCPCYSWEEGCKNGKVEEWHCQDCTDCLLKQIVELLKLCQHHRAIDKQLGMASDDTLSMLEIEECEE